MSTKELSDIISQKEAGIKNIELLETRLEMVIINRNEKMIDKHDQTLEVMFSAYMIKYTMVFNQIKRSNYGKGCDAFNNILEYEGKLCYTPTGNACFRKCLEFVYRKEFK